MARPAPSDDPFGMKIVPTVHQDTYPFINPEKGVSDIKVLVTGSSKGLGREMAKSFARAGASGIALLSRSPLDDTANEVFKAARAAGGRQPNVLKFQADVSDPAAVQRAMETIAQQFGSLDVVVNNASRLEKCYPLADTDVDDWWQTWEVNIKGTYIVTRAALPLVMKGQLKTIVTVSSAGAFISFPSTSAYQMTKTALIRLNDFLMAEYGEKGLIAYAIHPGCVRTETALNTPEPLHVYMTDTAELSADTIVWLTRERKEWLAGCFVWGPADMEELTAKKDEIVEKDLLKLKLTV